MKDNECLIYNMGKVGSVSMQVAIKQSGYKTLHGHWMIHTDGEFPTTKLDLVDKMINGELALKVITPVREPVARNVSAYFHMLKKYYPKYSSTEYDPDLLDYFLKNYKHDWPIKWFLREFGVVFGGVLNKKFNKNRGYQTYKSFPHDILIIRLEDYRRLGFKPVAKFLGIEDTIKHFPHSNRMRRNRAAYPRYKEFLEKVKMPEWYLDEIYDSIYAKYFYTDKEIEEFKNRWL